MRGSLEKLISVAGPPLAAAGVDPPADASRLVRELAVLLSRVNGFYAFESALHVLPWDAHAAEGSLQYWNADGLWRSSYGDLAEGHLFFAEDIFGAQFSIAGERICAFDPETGEADVLASSFDGWAHRILADCDVLTGFPLARAWQRVNGPLPPGSRLVPKVPFVVGGEFTVANLHAVEMVRGMRFRAGIATQIRDLPDGATVSFKIVE